MAGFKEMLKYLRSRENMSQAELAKKLGIAKSTVSMYEVGKREPDFETLEAIADLFNVDMNFLLGRTGSESDSATAPTDGQSTGYYLDPETAKIAQEMFDDPQMRSLFHMKRTMEPEKFQAHYDMMKKLYEMEHPEDSDDFSGC